MKLSDGSEMKIAKVYPLDATFDTQELIPEEVLFIYIYIYISPILFIYNKYGTNL